MAFPEGWPLIRVASQKGFGFYSLDLAFISSFTQVYDLVRPRTSSIFGYHCLYNVVLKHSSIFQGDIKINKVC